MGIFHALDTCPSQHEKEVSTHREHGGYPFSKRAPRVRRKGTLFVLKIGALVVIIPLTIKTFCIIIILINDKKWSDINIMRNNWREYEVTGVWKKKQFGFGCYAKDVMSGTDVALTGNQTRLLDKGDMIHASIVKQDKDWHGTPWYKVLVLLPVMRSKSDVIDYFSSDAFVGIGAKTAEDIYDALGIRAPFLLLHDISLLDMTPLSSRKKEIIKETINATRELDHIATLYPVFARRPKLLDAFNTYAQGQNMLTRLQEDPYQFIGDVNGFTFSVAEEIAYANGMDGHGEYRRKKLMANALKYVLDNNCGGDTYIDMSDNVLFNMWLSRASELSKETIADWYIPRETLFSHIKEMEDTEVTTLVMHKGMPHMMLRTYDNAENKIATWVKNQMDSDTVVHASPQEVYKLIDEYVDKTGDSMDDTQRLAVMSAIRSPLSIISGGPGRGKTRVAACVAWVFEKLRGPEGVAVLTSFTGKATRRLAESVRDTFDGVINMSTMLRFVYKQKALDFAAKNGITYRGPDTFKGNLVIIDEASMIDIFVMEKFLSIVDGAQVLIMGDMNQLPSIGAGEVLRDFIDSDVIPVTTLTTCYRASSGILISNADAILEDRFSDVVYDDAKFVWAAEGDNGLVDKIANNYLSLFNNGYDASDITILSGFSSQKDPLSVYYLNTAAQSKRKDLGDMVPRLTYGNKDRSVPFYVGDRCIMTRNAPDQTYDDSHGLSGGGKGLYNGDMGFIIDYDKYGVMFATDDGRVFNLSYELAENLELAYAITIHKSQGSEYSVVILAVSPRFALEWSMKSSFGSKNLLYTALTRAKNNVLLYGSKEGWQACLSTVLLPRKTHLKDLLQDIY